MKKQPAYSLLGKRKLEKWKRKNKIFPVGTFSQVATGFFQVTPKQYDRTKFITSNGRKDGVRNNFLLIKNLNQSTLPNTLYGYFDSETEYFKWKLKND